MLKVHPPCHHSFSFKPKDLEKISVVASKALEDDNMASTLTMIPKDMVGSKLELNYKELKTNYKEY